MRNQALVAVGLIAAALAVAACSSGGNGAGGAYGSTTGTASTAGSGSGYGYGYGTSSSPGTGTTSASGALRAVTTTHLGTVLASTRGMTLYYYTADKPGSGSSACTGECATAWPPLTGTAKAPSGIKLPGPIGSITRSGGVHQVTVNGYPLYTYAGDKAPGQVTGNGEAGEWHVIVLSSASGAKGGALKLELTSAGKVLANPHGMTVYYYTADKAGSGVSACTGACAAAWPPVVAPVHVPSGVKLPGPLGQIILPDGVRQVTINGYPIYRYADDKAPGQAKGNNEGGVWHVIKALTVTRGGY